MMESKLLLMMKGKFESLFILYTVYKMMEPWKHEPGQKKEKKKNGGRGKDFGAFVSPSPVSASKIF